MNNTEINLTETAKEPAPAAPKQTVRRIGVYTMGGSLVIIGVGILISMFNPSFDILLAAKLSPLILVALGLEILISTAVFKGEKLKYDFWSGFICFLLILFSIGAAIIPSLWRNYGPDRDITQNRLSAELEDQLYADLQSVPGVSRASVSLYLSTQELDPDMTLADLKSTDHIYVYVTLKSLKDKQEFAAVARTCLDRILSTNLPVSEVRFFAEDHSGHYEADLSGKFDFDNSASEIAEMTEYISYREESNTYTINFPEETAPVSEFSDPEDFEVTVQEPEEVPAE